MGAAMNAVTGVVTGAATTVARAAVAAEAKAKGKKATTAAAAVEHRTGYAAGLGVVDAAGALLLWPIILPFSSSSSVTTMK